MGRISKCTWGRQKSYAINKRASSYIGGKRLRLFSVLTRNGNAQFDAGRVANTMKRQCHHMMTPKDVFRITTALHRRYFASVEFIIWCESRLLRFMEAISGARLVTHLSKLTETLNFLFSSPANCTFGSPLLPPPPPRSYTPTLALLLLALFG